MLVLMVANRTGKRATFVQVAWKFHWLFVNKHLTGTSKANLIKAASGILKKSTLYSTISKYMDLVTNFSGLIHHIQKAISYVFLGAIFAFIFKSLYNYITRSFFHDL